MGRIRDAFPRMPEAGTLLATPEVDKGMCRYLHYIRCILQVANYLSLVLILLQAAVPQHRCTAAYEKFSGHIVCNSQLARILTSSLLYSLLSIEPVTKNAMEIAHTNNVMTTPPPQDGEAESASS